MQNLLIQKLNVQIIYLSTIVHGDHSRVEGLVEGVSVHHHTTKQSVILSATLVQLEEKDDQRNHQTHCTLEERASHTPVYIMCGWKGDIVTRLVDKSACYN